MEKRKARGAYRGFFILQFDMNFSNGNSCRNFWRKGVPTCWPSKAVTHIFPSNHVQTSVPPSDPPHLVVPC